MVAPTRRGLWLRLLVGAQVLYVLGVAGAGYATTALGQHIRLLTRPADVRELRQRDFVRLRYEVGEVPLAVWRSAAPPTPRQAAYVLLTPGPDSLWTVAGVFAAAPTPTAAQAVLRGWVTDVYQHSFGLRYNLERYFVPAESPLRHQKKPFTKPLRVQVGIAPWGQARIELVF